MTRVTKAVFPVAGLGTRFLPVTKASPKEMLPIVDKPLIQYAAEEAIAAGINELIFVTGRNKRSIEDHFDKAYELEMELKADGKQDLLDVVQNVLPNSTSCVYIRQPEALGLGHAVLCAKQVIGNDPFAVILADDLIRSELGVLRQMTDLYDRHQCSVIGVQNVAREDTHSYGIVKGKASGDRIYSVEAIVEKPHPDKAPSTLAVVGRYLLTPRIFELLERVTPGAGGEIQLTDGIAALLSHEQVLAYEFLGKRYDCGNKSGYLQATVEYALEHPELKEKFHAYLKGLKF
ncbi:MAG: UTP--glucose-1-phosphate uridylyltransferase GalU [Gammaproteobacteria bacterium]|nr:UTP--glucose-1-phosphate uridylyltransferase GalU [Gammaproteobacteria bacterium]MDH3370219.1 UTP--glucose-1-phosphate uridylyltransferase GalU [Gammaproteobacteria bacterium]MDH3563233.1 UTP--glucose-1-phosphate uridylyltransferase GalU [Gammaproteobacteria bacterium]MDH5488259.1 UTP--glucose-1-phosphate uridylyltransferase GalU [Gammaproteobacteria bacterium]